MRIKSILKLSLAFFISSSLLIGGVGCHRNETKRVETTEEYRTAQDDTFTRGEGSQTVDVTKKVEVTTEDSHRGLFGILWDIITLPFHAVAAIL
jgi:hypothetical protein